MSAEQLLRPLSKQAKFSLNDRVHAVERWLQIANMRVISEETGISLQTLKEWKTQPWWKDVETEILASKRIIVASKLGGIVDLAMNTIEDRLENGDFKYDEKKGELVRRPIPLKDATSAAQAMFQRQQQIDKQLNEQVDTEATKSIQDQLAILANEFAKFNNRSKSSATDIDFKEIPNAIHEERETRLQTGSEGIHFEASSGEEARGTEQSPAN